MIDEKEAVNMAQWIWEAIETSQFISKRFLKISLRNMTEPWIRGQDINSDRAV